MARILAISCFDPPTPAEPKDVEVYARPPAGTPVEHCPHRSGGLWHDSQRQCRRWSHRPPQGGGRPSDTCAFCSPAEPPLDDGEDAPLSPPTFLFHHDFSAAIGSARSKIPGDGGAPGYRRNQHRIMDLVRVSCVEKRSKKSPTPSDRDKHTYLDAHYGYVHKNTYFLHLLYTSVTPA